ncbi:NAD-dependent epimerase/dehydratase family protein [Sneathiella chungangensis]|uniref:NAD-dependent epimerase/dehydratase family protein n=1 Tax=Sneathiella chungangensis TaxID=1418234 RepID=A0A845MDV5_9PROT|nr:NAD(P)-dependent oxidoreductase [Sneathiella chungangensis]MZR22059.1 NAD-dependent epimerase/dehydratase family protein [Sneathiella chungangensis]
MKCCLVTGATGFIGRHVIRRLLAEGWQVLSISRNATLAISQHHEHVALDLHDPAAVDGLLKTRRPSHLIHLAWEATPGKFWHSTENFRWVSSSAFLLDAFVRHGGEKAVLAGSCAEYKWENSPLDEGTSPLNATTYYSASKLAFMALAGVIAKDISLVWARIFFPYGPDEDESKLISYIFREISAGRLPAIQAPDRAVDMIHVGDVAAALECLAASEPVGTVNICSGVAHLPHEIALECARLLDKDTLIPALDERVRQAKATSTLQGENSRLIGIWDKKPMSLSDGLKSYLEK